MEQKMQNARISGEAGGDTAPSHSMQDHTHHHHDHTASAVDQVCGMSVDPATASHKIERDGNTFYFCSERCKTRFAKNPAKYAAGKAQQPTHADMPEDAIYTCPM